jgi:hypothetical protein
LLKFPPVKEEDAREFMPNDLPKIVTPVMSAFVAVAKPGMQRNAQANRNFSFKRYSLAYWHRTDSALSFLIKSFHVFSYLMNIFFVELARSLNYKE